MEKEGMAMRKALEELSDGGETMEFEDFVEEMDAAEKMKCPYCGGKIIFSATGFYCTSCKKRVS